MNAPAEAPWTSSKASRRPSCSIAAVIPAETTPRIPPPSMTRATRRPSVRAPGLEPSSRRRRMSATTGCSRWSSVIVAGARWGSGEKRLRTVSRMAARVLLPAVASLGQTSLDVSRIGLGLAALGRPGYINLGHAADLAGETDVDALRGRAHEVLDAALAAGVRYFDAARSYGRAEEFLGSWLSDRGLRRGEVSVGLEVGLHLHRGLARRRRGQRGQGPDHRHAAPPGGRDPGAPRRLARALPDPFGDAGQRRAGGPRGPGRAGAAARRRRAGSPA